MVPKLDTAGAIFWCLGGFGQETVSRKIIITIIINTIIIIIIITIITNIIFNIITDITTILIVNVTLME